MQRNFEPTRKQVEAWQRSELTDVTAKVVIYEAFVESRLEAPKHLARTVHDLYFEPKYENFRPRTVWSLSSAFSLQGTGPHPAIQSDCNLENSPRLGSRSRFNLDRRYRPGRRSFALTDHFSLPTISRTMSPLRIARKAPLRPESKS